MRIVVATIGSRGDVQPYINLCQGLLGAGHSVALATNPTLLSLAAAYGVPAVPVGPPVDMGEAGARLMAQSFNNMWIGMLRVMQLGGRLVEEAYPDVLKVCRGADLVIVSDTGSGIAEAEKLGLPWISVTLQPGRIPSAETAPAGLGRLVWPLLGRLLAAPTNRFRKRVGAPPVQDIASMLSRRMILLPVSRYVAPPSPSWPSHVCQTGYWFARQTSGWTPPPDLVEFTRAGEKPLAVSLGVMSQSGKQARRGAELVLAALAQIGERAIIQGWDAVLQDMTLPETIFHAGSLPHGWLFEQVGAVIHHGGFGTTAAGLRAGVPVIVIPHVIDQFYWGQRVYELGVGPKFIPRGQLSAEKLAAAISQCRQDDSLRRRAAELGSQIRAEPDGVCTAVDAIQNLVL
jgi:sterol 3beta-glucosyltransferase